MLVAGCGALGNETLKNLALLGIGTIGILDYDVVERSNLGSSVLFREADFGRPKALVAAERIRELAPATRIEVMQLDLVTELGAGVVADYDLVLGCLDNIEARWRLNRLCRSAQVPWIDAGIEASAGQIAFFDGGSGPCYECSMTTSMWQRLLEKRSCLVPSLKLAPRAIPTTAIITSLVASLQTQEAVAQLHSRLGSSWSVLRSGDRVVTNLTPYSLGILSTKRNELCPAHEDEPLETYDLHRGPDEVTVEQLLALTGMDELELDWDIAVALDCPTCGITSMCRPAFLLKASELVCPDCQRPRRPEWGSRIAQGTELAAQTLAALGVPARAYLSLVTKNGRRIVSRLQTPSSMRT